MTVKRAWVVGAGTDKVLKCFSELGGLKYQ